MSILYVLFPNTMDKIPQFLESIVQTFQMVALSGVISFIIGMVLGVVLTVTKNGNIMQNAVVNGILDKVINIFRSIPFVILLTALLPLTRALVGTAIGTKGAIIPLIFGTVPFFSRQIEAALAELDGGLIEAAQSMGDSPWEITFKVYLRESIPSIVRGTTITTISLIGLTAMAGAIGGGGLGNFAIMWGHQRQQTDCTYAAMIVILALVFAVQAIGNLIIKKTTH
ncbi:MAG: methionine ABC transporter permease [Clostridiaceae bacterium]|nr:methionine ABC transporter permease [Clostridiaceae bacterium]